MTERDNEKLLSDYLMGEMTPEECARFETELAENVSLQQRLEVLRKLRKLVEASGSDAPDLSTDRRAELTNAASTNSAASDSNPRTATLLRFPRRFAWAAAAIMLAAGIAVVDENTTWLAPAFEAETSAALVTGSKIDASPLSDSTNTEARVAESLERRKGKVVAVENLSSLGYVARSSTPSAPPAPSTPAVTGNTIVGVGGGAGGKYGGRAGRGGATAPSPSRRRLSSSATPRDNLSLGIAGDKDAENDFRGSAMELENFDTEDSLPSEGFKSPPSYLGKYGNGCRLVGPEIIGHLHQRPNETPRDMFFRFYGDNAAVRANRDALSTFAADVDTASWALVRSYLKDKQLPPKEAVRTEEFLNWFDFDLAAPSEGDFAVHLSSTKSQYAQSKTAAKFAPQMLNIGIKARELARSERKPFNLVFVIDRSGSMKKGIRMEMVKRSLGLLLDQLGDDDTVGIVSFEGSAHLELEPTSASERWKIREAVEGIEMGGSTNAGEGLFLGYELAEGAWRQEAVNRVVFCSDGVANTGETDQKLILEKVRSYAEHDIDLTTIGVGMGNHNDVFLEQLANDGDGSCHYIDSYQEAKHILVERFIGTMQTVARDVKIQVEFNPDVVSRWRQLGYENRAVADQDFRNDKVDAGEIGAGHAVSALYEYDLQSGLKDGWVVKVRLRWFADGSESATEKEWLLNASELGADWNSASVDYRTATICAQFAEFMRRSYWTRGDSYHQLVAESQQLFADNPERAQLKELADLIIRTRELVEEQANENEDLAILIEEGRRLNLLEAEINAQANVSAELQAKLKELRLRNQELEEEIQRLLE